MAAAQALAAGGCRSRFWQRPPVVSAVATRSVALGRSGRRLSAAAENAAGTASSGSSGGPALTPPPPPAVWPRPRAPVHNAPPPDAARAAIAVLERLAADAGGSASSRAPSQRASAEATEAARSLTKQFSTSWSSFRAGDVHRIVHLSAKIPHCYPPLLEAVAVHVLRGMLSYPLFAICNIVNGFARLQYRHHKLLEATSTYLSEAQRMEQLSTVDIGCLVYAYAELSYRAGMLLEACAGQVKRRYGELDAYNCAMLFNSFSRLGECDPELFRALARAAVQLRPESFQTHHLGLILNACAKCSIRMPQPLYLVAGYLVDRVRQLSPVNVSQAVHACAKLELYDRRLFASLHQRLVEEDLSVYKQFELANVVHGFAKLRCGSARFYGTLYTALHGGSGSWDPRCVAQVLDAMRRMRQHRSEALLQRMLQLFLQELESHDVHGLTQCSNCLVDLDALDLLEKLPAGTAGLLELQPEETAAVCAMRLVFERMETLERQMPFTAMQRCCAQNLVRSYHYKHELDYGMLPQHVRTFCRSLFDVPSTVASSVARRRPRLPPASSASSRAGDFAPGRRRRQEAEQRWPASGAEGSAWSGDSGHDASRGDADLAAAGTERMEGSAAASERAAAA